MVIDHFPSLQYYYPSGSSSFPYAALGMLSGLGRISARRLRSLYSVGV
jgi:hypothetical protein